MFAKPEAPESVGQVLDGTFRLSTGAFPKVWWIAMLSSLASYPAAVYQFSGVDTLESAAVAPQDAIYWALSIIGGIVSMACLAAIFRRVDDVAANRAPSSNTLSFAIARAPMMFFVLLMYVLACVVGTLLLIVPGLVVMVSLLFALPIYLFEQRGPVASLTASHRLVWGHWWRTAAIFGIAGIIVTVLYFLVGIVAGLIGVMFSGQLTIIAVLVSTAIVSLVIGVLATPFLTALTMNVYWDLKLRKEGSDLAARVQAA
jgi:hypothetical protein